MKRKNRDNLSDKKDKKKTGFHYEKNPVFQCIVLDF